MSETATRDAIRPPTPEEFRQTFGTYKDVSGKWKGDVNGYHPHGVIRRPMVYIDHHNVGNYCDAYVMTHPDTKFYAISSGRDASCSNHGLPVTPKPMTGELVHVYSTGQWLGPDGPWRALMCQHMKEVRAEIEEIERREHEQREADATAKKAAAEAAYAAAAKACEATP